MAISLVVSCCWAKPAGRPGLDDLVSAFKISGRPAESFDRLVEAVDAAGQRAGKRIPIVIDGLNESEDRKLDG